MHKKKNRNVRNAPGVFLTGDFLIDPLTDGVVFPTELTNRIRSISTKENETL